VRRIVPDEVDITEVRAVERGRFDDSHPPTIESPRIQLVFVRAD